MTDGPGMEKGFNVMGIANGGVGYAMDEFNKDIVSADMKAVVDEASAQIADGTLMVHDYMSDDTCPALSF